MLSPRMTSHPIRHSLCLWLLLGLAVHGTGGALQAQQAEVGSPAHYDAILKKYVEGDYFQYGKLQKNAEDLDRFNRFMRWQAKADVKSMSRDQQIAFYINAYHSCAIKAVLDHYPMKTG